MQSMSKNHTTLEATNKTMNIKLSEEGREEIYRIPLIPSLKDTHLNLKNSSLLPN